MSRTFETTSFEGLRFVGDKREGLGKRGFHMAFQTDNAPHRSARRVAIIAMLLLLVPVAAWAKASGKTDGTLSLTPGAAVSGALGGSTVGNLVTFAPGLFTISTTGSRGFSGSLMLGTISGIDWMYTGHSSGFCDYTLTGFVSGTLCPKGTTVGGQTTQLLFPSRSLYNGGSIALSAGVTELAVPEQASIGLMGTGLVAIGLLLRRKLRSQSRGRS